jgi:hypothetical protein
MKREFGSLILAAILMTGAQASADGKGSQFGFMYGHSVPDAENTNPYILAGVKGEAFFLPTLSAGGYYLVSDGSGEPSVLDKFRYSIHGVQTAFHMAASGGDTWVALRVGLTKVKKTVNSEDVTFSPYHYGIATGYDYHLGQYFSLGFEGSYMHAQRGRTTQSGTSVNLDSFNFISFMISAQLRL